MPGQANQAHFKSAYHRYIAPLASTLPAQLGMNQSTHVGYVCLDPLTPAKAERAVVKCFHYSDPGWANELIAWSVAQELSVKTAPRAAVLIAQRQDITVDHGPEINAFVKYVTTPIVLWCTSAIEPTQPVQQVLGRNWETACLRTDNGKAMGAMDGWIGNCDRLAQNALYWNSGTGGLVAIDHEKMAFGQDWSCGPALHADEMLDAQGKPLLETRLISAIKTAHKSKDKGVKKAAGSAVADMFAMSKTHHSTALTNCRLLIERTAMKNFGTTASTNLLSFLDYRVSEDCMKRRFGILI
jgi:hypothetical protein